MTHRKGGGIPDPPETRASDGDGRDFRYSAPRVAVGACCVCVADLVSLFNKSCRSIALYYCINYHPIHTHTYCNIQYTMTLLHTTTT